VRAETSRRADQQLFPEDDYEEVFEDDQGYPEDELVDDLGPGPSERARLRYVRPVAAYRNVRGSPYQKGVPPRPAQKKKANNAKKITEWNAFSKSRREELKAENPTWNYSTIQTKLSEEFQAAKAKRDNKAKSMQSFQQLSMFIIDMENQIGTVKSELKNFSKLYDTSLGNPAATGVAIPEPAGLPSEMDEGGDEEKSDDDEPPATQPPVVEAPAVAALAVAAPVVPSGGKGLLKAARAAVAPNSVAK